MGMQQGRRDVHEPMPDTDKKEKERINHGKQV